MKLFTEAQLKQLKANSATNQDRIENAEGETVDFFPVVKLFMPCGSATWLLTELDDDNIAFGLCDLGMGCPELGSVSIDELKSIHVRGYSIERDLHFTATKKLSEYAKEAHRLGRIEA